MKKLFVKLTSCAAVAAVSIATLALNTMSSGLCILWIAEEPEMPKALM